MCLKELYYEKTFLEFCVKKYFLFLRFYLIFPLIFLQLYLSAHPLLQCFRLLYKMSLVHFPKSPKVVPQNYTYIYTMV